MVCYLNIRGRICVAPDKLYLVGEGPTMFFRIRLQTPALGGKRWVLWCDCIGIFHKTPLMNPGTERLSRPPHIAYHLGPQTKKPRSVICIVSSPRKNEWKHWKRIWQIRGPSLCFTGPMRFLHLRKAPLMLVAVLLQNVHPTGRTSVCFFIIVNRQDELPIINNIELTSTPIPS